MSFKYSWAPFCSSLGRIHHNKPRERRWHCNLQYSVTTRKETRLAFFPLFPSDTARIFSLSRRATYLCILCTYMRAYTCRYIHYVHIHYVCVFARARARAPTLARFIGTHSAHVRAPHRARVFIHLCARERACISAHREFARTYTRAAAEERGRDRKREKEKKIRG